MAHSNTYLSGSLALEVTHAAKTERDRLDRLDVEGLTYHYPDTGMGIKDVILHSSEARSRW